MRKPLLVLWLSLLIAALLPSPVLAGADFDGIPDGSDNCPNFHNPLQADVDSDGVGDFCDNCKYVSNSSQEDMNGNLIGDACDYPVLTLQHQFGAPAPDFDLFLDCRGFTISQIAVGLLIPADVTPTTANFGGGCEAPMSAPPGVPGGSGCSANLDLGPTVNPQASGAFYLPSPPAGVRDDVLYVTLEGGGAEGQLCDAFESPVFLGRFVTEGSPGVGTSALTFNGLAALTLAPARDTLGNPIETTTQYNAGPSPPLEIELVPASGEDPATAERWALCITDNTVQRMHRIAIGLKGVDGVSASDLYLEGCDGVPDGEGKRTCGGSVGPTVDSSVSFTVGPLASPALPLVEDTLYVVVEGSVPAPGATALNPTAFQNWCVGNIVSTTPPATPGESPLLVLEGLEVLDYHDGVPNPFQTSTALLDPLSLGEVGLENLFNAGDDIDDDGQLDEADNCPFIANPTQANSGDFQSLIANSDDDGDACECADSNGSGAVFQEGVPDPPGTPDLQQIREYLVGLPVDPTVVERCSVSEGVSCDTQDAVVLLRAFEALGPGLGISCDASLPPVAAP